MIRLTMLLALTLIGLSGCTSSGNVSPLRFCDRPTDINARVFTNCTPRVDDRV
ncbi:hypothetical protein SAMN05428967_2352 [Phyllobacterium sp. YR620]|uniref:hypothetical protein n=1 Tax=Phyllobacterium TaxID=28100 RepID=UPI000889294A|nr:MULTISPECIES: hypothetical protein [unclassified Phyllobacterium]UGY09660.1 hypothetical protein LLE51_000190 [Phyllobacterium sp. T1018]SDP48865.1 hypothetical protein SAMN05428967_2352 [Phyllobacterium sp. YR620]